MRMNLCCTKRILSTIIILALTVSLLPNLVGITAMALPENPYKLSYTFTDGTLPPDGEFVGDGGIAFYSGSGAKVVQVGPENDRRWALTPGVHNDRYSICPRVFDGFFARGSEEPITVKITLEYYGGDVAAGAFTMYNKAGGTFGGNDWGPGIDIPGDQTWKTATYTFNDAEPKGETNILFGGDFEFGLWYDGGNGADKLYIHKITIEREGEPPAAVTPFKLFDVYSNNMVFQAGEPVNIDGMSESGSTITATLSDGTNTYTKTAVANEQNKFRVTFDETFEAGYTPYTLKVTSSLEGSVEKTFNNIVFGDVYLTAGQSNMVYPFNWGGANPLYYQNAKDPVLADYYNNITADEYLRFYGIDEGSTNYGSVNPKDDYGEGRVWKSVENKESVFFYSAASYIFAKNLRDELDYPVAFVPIALGGSAIEQWVEGGKLYNSRAYPFKPFSFKGVLWYQGEANSFNNSDYIDKQIAVIEGFRNLYRNSDLPFCMVQLANFTGDDYRVIRQKQLDVFNYYENLAKKDNVKNTVGIISLVDQNLIHPDNIHPDGKKDIGDRFTTWALSAIYNKYDEYSGPVVKCAYKSDDNIVIKFDHVGDGLKSKDGSLEIKGFELVSDTTLISPGSDGDVSADVDEMISYTFDSTTAPSETEFPNGLSVRNAGEIKLVGPEGDKRYAATPLTGANGDRYAFYLRLGEKFRNNLSGNVNMYIEYYDVNKTITNPPRVLYNDYSSGWGNDSIINITGSETWKTAVINLNNLTASGSMMKEGDIELLNWQNQGSEVLWIHKIVIAKEGVELPSPPVYGQPEKAVTAKIRSKDTVIIEGEDVPQDVVSVQYAYEMNNVGVNLMNSVDLPALAFSPVTISEYTYDSVYEVQLKDESGKDTYSVVPGGMVTDVKLKDSSRNTGKLIIAVYDDGCLAGITSLSVAAEDYSEDSDTAIIKADWKIPTDLSSENITLKAFFWNSEKNIMPLVDNYSL